MPKVIFGNKLIKIRDYLYGHLVKINDTPQKVAFGFGLGVFSGIFPLTGPLAALFLAFMFRANRMAALLGSLLTNTWLSLATFLLAIRLGSAIFKISWIELKEEWLQLIKSGHWQGLFKVSALKITLPVICGYLIISFLLGLIAYIGALIIIKNRRH